MKMRWLVIPLLSALSLLAYNNCGKNGFEKSLVRNESSTVIAGGLSQPLPIVGTEPNAVKITMGCGYINEPCVSVTICEPNTSNCQTIPNVLLDTGSYGLRLFSSVVSLNLSTRVLGGGSLAECVSYADGTSQWGPIKSADVVLGQLKASNLAVHIIDSAFGTIPADCTNPDTAPSAAGYNGILGVGLFTEDCGPGCANTANNRIYFTCVGATCSPTAVPVAQQVSNPVPFLPADNNGVVVQLPAIPSTGAPSLAGWMVLGVGTRSNNSPQSANVLPTDRNGYIQTSFNGKSYSSSFIDSGSNGLFFPGSGALSNCSTTGIAIGFFCPATPTKLTAVQIGKSGAPQISVNFEVTNGEQALAISNPNIIFNNIGGNFADSFDWGLPFYLGRTVFHGIDGKASSLGPGPYFAW